MRHISSFCISGLQSTYPFIVNPNLRNPQAQAHWLDNKTQLLLFIQPLGLVTNYFAMMENFLSETWSRNTNSIGMYSSFFFPVMLNDHHPLQHLITEMIKTGSSVPLWQKPRAVKLLGLHGCQSPQELFQSACEARGKDPSHPSIFCNLQSAQFRRLPFFLSLGNQTGWWNNNYLLPSLPSTFTLSILLNKQKGACIMQACTRKRY